MSFDELRALAESHDITRLAIETRKDQIEKLDWAIKPRREKPADADARARGSHRLAEFWRRPDGERPFATWLRELLEDVLVLDAPALELRRNRGGDIIGLDIVDGATIKLLLDETGRRPKPPAPAYRAGHPRPAVEASDRRRAALPAAQPAAAQGLWVRPGRADRDDGQHRRCAAR